VHFWALSLLLKDEYARVGVPMMPVVRGDRATVVKIVLYALVTFAVSLIPFFMHRLGILYLVSATILSGVLIAKSVQLYNKVERKQASALFHYSMIYLAALFLMMAVDRFV
jgi:protoheme IX farnesyltransferase